jgi:hypothetical protein
MGFPKLVPQQVRKLFNPKPPETTRAVLESRLRENTSSGVIVSGLQIKAIQAEQQFGEEIAIMKAEVIPNLRKWGHLPPEQMDVTVGRTLEFLARCELYHQLYSKAGLFELGDEAFPNDQAPVPKRYTQPAEPTGYERVESEGTSERLDKFAAEERALAARKANNFGEQVWCDDCLPKKMRAQKGVCDDGKRRCKKHALEHEQGAGG